MDLRVCVRACEVSRFVCCAHLGTILANKHVVSTAATVLSNGCYANSISSRLKVNRVLGNTVVACSAVLANFTAGVDWIG